ncbi:hypothetical protein LUZ63_004520 [Rhynchospora breviuscula]|uniref:Ribosomal protein L19 n=1 Tax=Rhynchospora breviuscula TaxID=2022672 RepID=A0A9Q0I038_9POAL|nr:hypothetical protein LUZ63_004520 [Rhynchospora breviuscula]
MQSVARALFRATNGDGGRRIMQSGSGSGSLSTFCPSIIQKASDIFERCSLFRNRCMSTAAQPDADLDDEHAASAPPRVKFKRLDKTAKQIMAILDKEAVHKVSSQRELPDIQPGCILQLKLEVPENKRRLSTLKGIVIARRNAGFNTTFRLRRLVAGVGVESVFPLYSPNIKEMKILDRKKVRRAKLYYLRDRMNALKK